jgi:hypothetical protein
VLCPSESNGPTKYWVRRVNYEATRYVVFFSNFIRLSHPFTVIRCNKVETKVHRTAVSASQIFFDLNFMFTVNSHDADRRSAALGRVQGAAINWLRRLEPAERDWQGASSAGQKLFSYELIRNLSAAMCLEGVCMPNNRTNSALDSSISGGYLPFCGYGFLR